MITLHCPCGATISTGPGPASVTCKCGKVHPLPRLGPAAPVAAPPPATSPEPKSPAPENEIRENPFGPRHRVAIHDGLPAPRGDGAALGMLQNPIVAGGISVGVLLIALVVAVVLRSRADRLRTEAASAEHGTECSFLNAGIAFTAPPHWKLVRNEGMTFAFETPKGEVAVSVLQVTAETHFERAKSFQPTGDWKAAESELAGGEGLASSWAADSGREAASWWLERASHRLWISAQGKSGVRAEAATLIKSLKLSEPTPVVPAPR